jgi:hypothetical protein
MKIYIITKQYNDYNQHEDSGYFIRAFRELPTRSDTVDIISEEEHDALIKRSSTHEYKCFSWYELIVGNC